jgi:hypothetical protein
VAKPARSGVDEDGDLPFVETEHAGSASIEHFVDDLHLQEVVATSQRSELRMTSLTGALGNATRICAWQAAARFEKFQILFVSEAEPPHHAARDASEKSVPQMIMGAPQPTTPLIPIRRSRARNMMAAHQLLRMMEIICKLVCTKL